MQPLNDIRYAVQKMAGIAGSAVGNAPGPDYSVTKNSDGMGTKGPDVVAAYYSGGFYNVRDALNGAAPRSKETQNYVAGVDATLGATPMPASPNSSGSPDDRNRPFQIAGEATIRLVDKDGNHRGSTILRPYAAAPPAGSRTPSSWWDQSTAWPQ